MRPTGARARWRGRRATRRRRSTDVGSAAPPQRDLQALGGPVLRLPTSSAVRGPAAACPGSLCVAGSGSIEPLLPLRPGERRTHDYKRNGTTSLFAALDIATGTVIGQCHRRHRKGRKFLDHVEANVPPDPTSTSSWTTTRPTRRSGLVRPASALACPFHADLCLARQIRRGVHRSTAELERAITATSRPSTRPPSRSDGTSRPTGIHKRFCLRTLETAAVAVS